MPRLELLSVAIKIFIKIYGLKCDEIQTLFYKEKLLEIMKICTIVKNIRAFVELLQLDNPM